MHEEVARIADDGVGADELRRVQARTEAQLLRQADSVLGRTLGFAAAEIVHGRAELAGELAARLAAVTPEQVQAAARDLDPDTAAVLELRATGGANERRAGPVAGPAAGRAAAAPGAGGAGDDAAQRAAGRRRAAARRPADRAAAPRALRGGRRARPPARTPRAPSVLSGAVLLGTAAHDQTAIAELLQSHGAELSVSTDPDRLLFATTLLTSGLEPVLGLLAELLTGATYPADAGRGRARPASPSGSPSPAPSPGHRPHRAGRAPLRRAPLRHPAARHRSWSPPSTGAALRAVHRDHMLPAGSTLVLVGDLDPQAATDAVGTALAGWSASGHALEAPPAPELHAAGHRAGRPARRRPVQRPARGPGTGRTEPDLAAVRLANMIFGGYFSSRLVENIRERRGYTYSPRSSVDHQAAGSSFLVEADVATDVTGPALLETWYELGRMALVPVTDAELDGARRYVLGSMALATATHAGLASTLSALVGAGLPVDWLAEHQRDLAAVTVEEVQEASRRYLAASGLTTVVVGDAGRIAESLGALAPVSVAASDRPRLARRTPADRRGPGAGADRARPGAPVPRAPGSDRRPPGPRAPRRPARHRARGRGAGRAAAGLGRAARRCRPARSSSARPVTCPTRRSAANDPSPSAAGRSTRGRACVSSGPISATSTPVCSCRPSASWSGTTGTGSAR